MTTPTVTRRQAVVAALVAPAISQPYYPGQNTSWVTVDWSKLEQLTIRLPQGMVTYSAKELWEALQK